MRYYKTFVVFAYVEHSTLVVAVPEFDRNLRRNLIVETYMFSMMVEGVSAATKP